VPAADVEQLLDDAFGADRHQRTAYLLRKGMPVIDHLSFGIEDGGAVVGSIQCWPIAVEDAPLVLVGPVAVSPDKQNSGFGKQLMHAALSATTSTDAPMVMIGDPEYYGRFGFDAIGTVGWTLPGPWEPRRLLLRNPNNVSLPFTGMLGPRTSL
jgi:predicted N-acetyltransferase YhbS